MGILGVRCRRTGAEWAAAPAGTSQRACRRRLPPHLSRRLGLRPQVGVLAPLVRHPATVYQHGTAAGGDHWHDHEVASLALAAHLRAAAGRGVAHGGWVTVLTNGIVKLRYSVMGASSSDAALAPPATSPPAGPAHLAHARPYKLRLAGDKAPCQSDPGVLWRGHGLLQQLQRLSLSRGKAWEGGRVEVGEGWLVAARPGACPAMAVPDYSSLPLGSSLYRTSPVITVSIACRRSSSPCFHCRRSSCHLQHQAAMPDGTNSSTPSSPRLRPRLLCPRATGPAAAAAEPLLLLLASIARRRTDAHWPLPINKRAAAVALLAPPAQRAITQRAYAAEVTFKAG